ncbi:excinuclease ABC subunit UvrC [Algoriphagus sp. AGSA1]|uniref:excinuclease ABC subunit UvrC n=1 Tax=Algoriphagus sp. AGSA1 TaxID=2907213 RepID=UPI001F1D25AA|nr:excinuclease ABC subunit UvrC [Algoriphagus sp. AGSA1]MCE7056622.1 excinuclease ABC subunit UvrC [Algoriphagus sp. AGSA1]
MQSSSFSPNDHATLPDHPGVYKYFNEDGELIYVGKAKSLKKRVGSYFNKSVGFNLKTRKMVKEIRRIEITLVNSEFDALLLENNLIKKSQPKYNILLRDDKTYPYLLLTKEHFPRIFPTRNLIAKKGTYFGPFASVKAMNNVLDLIRELFTIRTCNLDLSPYKIAEDKYKVCLEYHIGNCQGPCVGLQNEGDYLKDLEHAKHILKGNLGLAKSYFKQEMQTLAENLEFEKAQKLKEKLDLLEKYQAKSLVASPSINNLDVCTIVSDEKNAYVNYMRVKNGSLITSKNVELKKKLDESDEQLLLTALIQLQDQFQSDAEEVLLNIELTEAIEGLNVFMPKIGDKKKLIELSLKNALYYKKEKALLLGLNQDKKDRVIRQLQQDLTLPEIPDHIECFDNSNIQGTNPVASMVCFLNGKPAVKEYRHYHIKTVTGPDDFASMKEVVGRRYKRLLEEGKPMPKLVVIDGGKGQLSSAVEALKELGVYGQMPIIGIAKRLEEIYFPGDSYPIHIDKKSESLRLLQRIRDEAHRFAITFHRNVRSKNAFGTQLTAIPGIGKNTAVALLSHFKSVKKISLASEEEIANVIGASRAKALVEWRDKNKGA